MSRVGTRGRLYVTKHVWVPEKPLQKLNLRIADALRKHMPPLPAQGESALTRFPALREFQANHEVIKRELLDVLQIKPRIPEGEPLLFDDTYAHSVDNDTDELRAVLIVDFEPPMSPFLDAFLRARYVLVRRSEEIRTICAKANVAS